jgi:tetratricopeptide (TPR) repeat protein
MKLITTLLLGLCATATAGGKATDKLPITTTSEDARALYIKAQDFADKLRATDAHELFVQAVAKDASFAMAYLGMASSSGTTKDFFDALGHAVKLADKVSPGEKLVILSADQGAKNDLVHQRQSLDKLVQLFPSDERVRNQLGQYLFIRQDYPAAIAAYEKAISINPTFTQPYNQLGYAYRFTDKLADAERTFKKYIELIPGDPNPYDSYAELLMQEGK